jgi:hypothetical protein
MVPCTVMPRPTTNVRRSPVCVDGLGAVTGPRDSPVCIVGLAIGVGCMGGRDMNTDSFGCGGKDTTGAGCKEGASVLAGVTSGIAGISSVADPSGGEAASPGPKMPRCSGRALPGSSNPEATT